MLDELNQSLPKGGGMPLVVPKFISLTFFFLIGG